MIESSQFTSGKQHFESLEQADTQGATCDTYRVRLYGKLHFLKRLKPAYSQDIRYREALRKEFETGYRLEHPNLVRYVSVDDDSILMEYVDGETLARSLLTNPDFFKNRRNTDKLLRQLIDVVGYLHSHQVLHLDLKPDNLLLTRINKDLKLIDLGCCYTDTFTDTQGYTSQYAAPEQLSGGTADERTDIYAIGKIMEQLPNRSIYNKVIRRCTEEAPADRYQSAEELGKALIRRSLWKPICLVLLSLALIAGIVIYMQRSVSNHGQSTATFVAPADTLSAMPVDTPAVVPDEQAQHTPAPTIPVAKSTKSADVTQLRADITKAVLPKFNATLGALPDSVSPGTEQWAEKSWAFISSLEETDVLKELRLSYPNIPEKKLTETYNTYIQSLIDSKVNKAQKHQAGSR